MPSSSSPALEEEEEEESMLQLLEEDVDDKFKQIPDSPSMPRQPLENLDKEFQQVPNSPELSFSIWLEDDHEIISTSQSQSPQEMNDFEFRLQSRSRSSQVNDGDTTVSLLRESMENTTTSNTCTTDHDNVNANNMNNIKKWKEKERADEMPEHLRSLIFGDEVVGKDLRWINTKHMYKRDIYYQNCLYLPNKELEEVLTEEEKEVTHTADKDGIEVHVFDSKMVVRKMKIKWWTSCKRYVLYGLCWKRFARHNKVEEGDTAEIWSFRSQFVDTLCLVINIRKAEKNKKKDQDSKAKGGGASTSETAAITDKKHKGTLEKDDKKKQNIIMEEEEKVNANMKQKITNNNKKKKEKEIADDDEPIMPEQLTSVIFGNIDLRWISTKHINASDIRNDQNHLYLPNNEIEQVLTEEEEEVTHTEDKDGIEVLVFDSSNKCGWMMKLKWWTCCQRYVLNSHWKNFATDNKVEGGDTAEIWSFRNNSDMLCLTINFRKAEKNKKKDQHPKGDGASTSGTVRRRDRNARGRWC
ncbi:hypothetical protein FRX31_012681 [Thalictrum thalictroides]|uniref:TF-B3 domain-containing protein n=1 Tax=Thalictrum thalictroides TaxID=46969 RepID=A0A7J6WMQ7_THATH|nr:hypothetical protein FRX31_012681 [Thalictrum thalictroides]